MTKHNIIPSNKTLALPQSIISTVITTVPDNTAEYFYVSTTGNVSFYKKENKQSCVWNKGLFRWDQCIKLPDPLHDINNLVTPLEDTEIVDKVYPTFEEPLPVFEVKEVITISTIIKILEDNLSQGYFIGTPPVGETAFFINFSQDQEWVVVHTIYDQAQSSIYNPLVSNSLVAMKKLTEYLNKEKITPKDIKLI